MNLTVYLPLATLVPVLNRPQNVKPLIRSFQASRTPGLLVVICELDDIDEQIELERWAFPSMRVITVVDAHTWPEKINVGVEQIAAQWYLCAADDVDFYPGWWKATEKLRDDKKIGVIGTNDLGNPRVIAGEHTCHPLIRRDYILNYGTWDEPRRAIHEGYKHWYCDDELVITAKMRDAWAFCEDAVVKHDHPYWVGGELDDTYRLGESHADQDRALFVSRMAAMGVELA